MLLKELNMASCPKCGRGRIRFRKGTKNCPKCGLIAEKEYISEAETNRKYESKE
jgi:uncharacterized Zn finger protein (UPF0148 family)